MHHALKIHVAGGPKYGPNIVSNGTFADGTGWTTGTGWAIGSGVATATASTANLDGGLIEPVVSRRRYRLEFTITAFTGGTVRMCLTAAGSNTNATGVYGALGRVVEEFNVTSTAVDGVRMDAVTSFSGSVDDLSVREALRP